MSGSYGPNHSLCNVRRCAGKSAYDIPELVCAVYETAPVPLRTKLLECLLRPVGPLALVAIAAGAFGHLLYRLRRDAMPISLDDLARITPGHVLELTRYVEQCSPHVLLRIGSLIAASDQVQFSVFQSTRRNVRWPG